MAAAYAVAAALAMSRSLPPTTSSAPSHSSIASFDALAPSGTNTTAAIPSRTAAQAVAAPWLPVDAVTTVVAPRLRYWASVGSAPRHLNAPNSCSSSR